MPNNRRPFENIVIAVSTERLFQTPKGLGLIEEKLQLPDGSSHLHYTITHRNAVVILPVTEFGEILLLKQYRHSVGETIWELPAGNLEADEEPQACAEREIQEETGFAAKEWHSLGSLFPAPSYCNRIQFCFLARNLVESRKPMDEDEVIEVYSVTLEEVMSMIGDGILRDGKSLATILRARCLGLL